MRRRPIAFRHKTTKQVIRQDTPGSELRGTEDEVLRRHGRNPSDWQLVGANTVSRELLPRRRRVPNVLDLAIFTLGGLGDDLTKLNLARQLLGPLRERYPLLHVTWVGRQEYSIFSVFDFIDDWRYIGAKRHINDISPVIAQEYDLTLELRYEGQFLKSGVRWSGDGFEGLNAERHVCDVLAESLGEFAFTDDHQYLKWFLDKVQPLLGEQRRLKRLIGEDPYVVVANGTDPLFRKRLVKAIPAGVIYEVSNTLHEHGIRTVQVGTPDVEFVEAHGATNLIGKTTLDGLTWLLRGSLGFFSCEGGVAHLASQMQKPGVVLFGATPMKFWGYPANLNLQSPNSKCTIQPCWFHKVDGKMDQQWHERCYAAETHQLELIRGYPQCMGSFNPEWVGEQVVDFILSDPEDIGLGPGLPKPPGRLRTAITRVLAGKPKDDTFHREDWMTVQWVTKNIAIGDKESAKTIGLLRREGITASFNVSDDATLTTKATNIVGTQVGLIDGAGNPVALLEAAERKVRALLKDHDKILVHCHGGVSRSATVCALHLVKTKMAKDFKSAVTLVQKARPQCQPDPDLAITAEAVVAGWKGKPRA